MIKVITDWKQINQTTLFPQLMVSNSGQIILVTKYNEQTKQYTGVNINGIGWSMGHWSDGWAADSFTTFAGKITLSNDKS